MSTTKPKPKIRPKKIESRATRTLNDLEDAYVKALKAGKYSAAIRAKELIGRELGLFKGKGSIDSIDIKQLSDDELRNLSDMVNRAQEDTILANQFNEDEKNLDSVDSNDKGGGS